MKFQNLNSIEVSRNAVLMTRYILGEGNQSLMHMILRIKPNQNKKQQ